VFSFRAFFLALYRPAVLVLVRTRRRVPVAATSVPVFFPLNSVVTRIASPLVFGSDGYPTFRRPGIRIYYVTLPRKRPPHPNGPTKFYRPDDNRQSLKRRAFRFFNYGSDSFEPGRYAVAIIIGRVLSTTSGKQNVYSA